MNIFPINKDSTDIKHWQVATESPSTPIHQQHIAIQMSNHNMHVA